MKNKVSFRVDNKDIPLNMFTQDIIRNIFLGIIASLKDINDPMETMQCSLKQGSQISLEINNSPVEMNGFVRNFMRNIIQAILESLYGIPDEKDLIVLKVN